jgi:hypothetical protein
MTDLESAEKQCRRLDSMYMGMCVVALEQGGHTIQAENLAKEASKNEFAASGLAKARSDFEIAVKAWK